MAMTAAVKDEISRLPVTRTCCRKAEVSAILRFAGGLHLVSGRIVIEAELDTGDRGPPAAQDILEIFGHSSELIVMAPGGLRRGSRATSCGWSRAVTSWPARPGWWTAAAARSAACPRRWSPGPPATPRPPGAGPSWPTARSPSPAAPPRWR